MFSRSSVALYRADDAPILSQDSFFFSLNFLYSFSRIHTLTCILAHIASRQKELQVLFTALFFASASIDALD